MIRLLLLLLAVALPARAADFTGLDWQQRQGAMLPTEAPLIDADGQPTTLGQVANGKPLILAPGYFQCPNLCGVVRDDLFAALADSGLQPGRDYNAALITIDPTETLADAKNARESVLSRYPNAKFATLTGPKSSLDAVADAAGFKARFDQATRQFLHPAGVVIASPNGRIATYLMGVGYGEKKLAAAVAAAEANLTAPAEPIHLFCFSYDPATGKFSASVMEALRLAGVLTVLVIGGGLYMLTRRT